MQYLVQLGLGILIGGVIVTFVAGLLRDLGRTSFGFILMVVGLIMITIYLKECMSQLMLIVAVLAIACLVIMAGYKYWKSRRREKEDGDHA